MFDALLSNIGAAQVHKQTVSFFGCKLRDLLFSSCSGTFDLFQESDLVTLSIRFENP